MVRSGERPHPTFSRSGGVISYAAVSAQVPFSFGDIKVGEEFVSPGRTGHRDGRRALRRPVGGL